MPSTGRTCPSARGEIVALVGESGSGKTTLARTLMGLQRPSRGEVRFEGKPLDYSIRGLRRFRSQVQMVLQDAAGSLNPRQTVYESVAEGIRLHRRVASDAEGRTEVDLVSAALAEAGLRPPERLFLRYPHELSGGQKQRVLIAGALALRPQLLHRRRAGLLAGRLDPRRDPRAAAPAARGARASASSWSPTTSAWPGTSPTGSR